MADTTIKLDARVRDRLALLAAQRGSTIRDLVTELAAATPTREELDLRYAEARDYIRERVDPDLDDAREAAQTFWGELSAGRTPTSIG